jgi:hypothetical protein
MHTNPDQVAVLSPHAVAYTFYIMRRMIALLASVLSLVSLPLIAQTMNTYRDRTGTAEVVIRMEQDPLPHGFLVRSFLSDGDFHEVEYGAADTTVRYRVVSPARNLDYSARREGNLLSFEGVLSGKQISRTQQIDDSPWFETIEVSIRAFVLAAPRSPKVFWIVQPWEAKAHLMQASNEGADTVSVNDVQTETLRVRVSAAGLLSLFWSSLYWYRSSDGSFVKYEAVRGPPGFPLTTVELVSEN